MATGGVLLLTIVEARLDRDVETDGTQMDPFVQIVNGKQMMRTKTQDEAGKTPKWGETVELDVGNIGNKVTIRVKDENVTDACLVGETEIKLSAFCVNGGIEDWWQLSFNGKKAGEIHLIGDWHPSSSDSVAISAAFAPGLQQTMQQ